MRFIWLLPLVFGLAYVLFAVPALIWDIDVSIHGGGPYAVAYTLIHAPVASVLLGLGMGLSDASDLSFAEREHAELSLILAVKGIVLVMVIAAGTYMGWSLDRVLEEERRSRGPRAGRDWVRVAAMFITWPGARLFRRVRKRVRDEADGVSDSDNARSGPAPGRRS